MTIKEISAIWGMSYRSLRYEMRKRNIEVRQKYCTASDRRIKRYVNEILSENHRLGKMQAVLFIQFNSFSPRGGETELCFTRVTKKW